MNKQPLNSQSGMIMVEAAIYFPLVICTVMALIYFALFKYQESTMLFQVNRIAMNCARQAAYPGYDSFAYSQNSQIDFDWDEDVPSEESVQQYYSSYFEDLGVLYRELTGHTSVSEESYTSQLQTYLNQTSLFAFGAFAEPEVSVEGGLLRTTVQVEVTYRVVAPGVLRYLGVNDDIGVHSRAYAYAVNPTEFIRNTDLAVDLTNFLLEKLGMKGKVDDFMEKACKIRDQIL